jgi:chromosome segregation ATPase
MAMTARRAGGGRGDEQVQILRGIWNEMKALNAGVDQTNARLDQTNTRLDAVRTELRGEIEALRRELRDEIDGLRRRVVESEVRLATATTQLSSDVQTLSGLIREWREEHRADRAEIKLRLGRLEQHVGLPPR